MRIDEALGAAVTAIADSGCATGMPLLDAQVILAYVLDCDRAYLLAHPERRLAQAEEAQFEVLIKQRMAGRPVAYIVQKKEFMGLDFYVDENVLIPRGDTEILVQEILTYARNKALDVLNIGSGSGCIEVALAVYHSQLRITGVEKSVSALRIAERNVLSHGVDARVRLYCGDLFDFGESKRRYDIICANPPYITTGELGQLDRDVQMYEPFEALCGGADGLDYYHRMIDKAHLYLKEGSALFFEIGSGQAVAVTDLMKKAGYKKIRCVQDYGGLDRVVFGLQSSDVDIAQK